MNTVKLFTVAEAFQISGRGCVLAKGVPVDAGLPDVQVGSAIRLVKPNGESIDTWIDGIEMMNYGRRIPEKLYIPISLPRIILKQDVPPGTHVFLLMTETERLSANKSFKRM